MGGISFCQLFGRKNFRGMILPPSIIRVRQSWDNGARVFARRRNTFSRQAVAPLGGVLNDTSGAFGLRLEERQTESPRNKIREGASLEEQVRSASCPSLADILAPLFKPCRTRKLRLNDTIGNSRHPHKSKKI